VKPFIVC